MAASGDRSTPPISGMKRRNGRTSGSARREIRSSSIGEAPGTHESTAYTTSSAVSPDTASCSRPMNDTSGSAPMRPRLPIKSHSTRNLAITSSQAATALARSHFLTAGSRRRSGSTIQSVMAKMKRPSGLPKGTRWYCM